MMNICRRFDVIVLVVLLLSGGASAPEASFGETENGKAESESSDSFLGGASRAIGGIVNSTGSLFRSTTPSPPPAKLAEPPRASGTKSVAGVKGAAENKVEREAQREAERKKDSEEANAGQRRSAGSVAAGSGDAQRAAKKASGLSKFPTHPSLLSCGEFMQLAPELQLRALAWMEGYSYGKNLPQVEPPVRDEKGDLSLLLVECEKKRGATTLLLYRRLFDVSEIAQPQAVAPAAVAPQTVDPQSSQPAVSLPPS